MTQAQEHKSRVFRTYIDDGSGPEGRRFVLMTTSKDLHLKLGSFEWSVNYHLAKFLEEEFTRNRCSQLLLCFKTESENSEQGFLVSRTAEDNCATVFTLALAR